MKISYNWIKDHINIDESPYEISKILTSIGLEIIKLEERKVLNKSLKDIKIGIIKKIFKHPNADKLQITNVNIGGKNDLQIICGAKNIEVNQKIPVATVNSYVKIKENKVKIVKTKIRNELSEGMLCSEQELEISKDSDGIMILDIESQIGQNMFTFFESNNIKDDYIFDIDLTPNRNDAMCHLGVARDIKAALNHRKNINIEISKSSIPKLELKKKSNKISINIDSKEDVKRYMCVSMSNIQVKESPIWLKNKLNSIGVSSINNIVDISNLVLHDIGQPLHIFDLNSFPNNQVLVRKAKSNEKIITLDHKERILSSNDLIISNSKKDALCLAGIMGSQNSIVTKQTTDILIESAHFNPICIRKSAKKYKLNTDASFRFERGIDIDNIPNSINYAIQLIKEITGAELSSDLNDYYPQKVKPIEINLCLNKVYSLIGHKIKQSDIENILKNLDIQVLKKYDDKLKLSIASYREDVKRDIDVIEEILRIYDLNNTNKSKTISIPIRKSIDIENKYYYLERRVANYLISNGFFEVMNNSLSKEKYAKLNNNHISIKNALSKDLAILRYNPFFGLLENISYNINRKEENLKLFEFGKIYSKNYNNHNENKFLSLAMNGNIFNSDWMVKNEKANLYHLKNFVNNIISLFNLKPTQTKYKGKDEIFSNSISILSGEFILATLGMVNNKLKKEFSIKGDVLIANIDWNLLLTQGLKTEKTKLSPLLKYPKVIKDLSLIIDKNLTFEKIKKSIEHMEDKIIQKIQLFDVYEDNMPNGKKFYGLRFTMFDKDKTLTDDIIKSTIDNIIRHLEINFNANIRE